MYKDLTPRIEFSHADVGLSEILCVVGLLVVGLRVVGLCLVGIAVGLLVVYSHHNSTSTNGLYA